MFILIVLILAFCLLYYYKIRLFKRWWTKFLVTFVCFPFSLVLFFILGNPLHKTLAPGESVEIQVHAAKAVLEPQTELYIEKEDNGKLQLSGQDFWSTRESDIYYIADEGQPYAFQYVTDDKGELIREKVDSDKEEQMSISDRGLLVYYKGEKMFGVTSRTPYTITITNVDQKPVSFTSYLIDR